MQFRRVQQQDEHGDVPADGLIRAKRHVDQMRRMSPVKWTWLGPGNTGVAQFYGAAGNALSGTIVGGTKDTGTLRYTRANGTQAYTRMLGGDGGQVASDPDDPDYFYGEYPGLGIFRSSNGGESPEIFFGDAIPDFNGHSLFIAPFILDANNPNTLLAGGMSLWRTNDAKFGQPPSFTSIKGPIGSYVSAIAIAPGNSAICWVGYQNGDVYNATDCTAASPTWTRVDTNGAGLPNRMVLRLTIDPTDPSGNRVYAAFGGFRPGNLWKTTNGGASWSGVSGAGVASLPAAPVHDLEIHPSTSNRLYAATEIGVFTSQDAGVTWQPPQDGPADVIVSELFWMGRDLVAATFGRGLYKTAVDDNIDTKSVSGSHAIDPAATEAAAAAMLFSDDMESGADGWSAQPPWAITSESAHSPDHAWSDSPGGAYGPNLNVSLLTPVIDLTSATSPELTFWHKRQFAADGFDSGQVWATTDLGSTYTLLATYTGTDLEWSQATIDLSAYAGVPSLRVAFQVQSDADLTGDGWYVDDVAVNNVPPSPFGKSQPANGSTDLPIPQGLGLTWHESTGATSYDDLLRHREQRHVRHPVARRGHVNRCRCVRPGKRRDLLLAGAGAPRPRSCRSRQRHVVDVLDQRRRDAADGDCQDTGQRGNGRQHGNGGDGHLQRSDRRLHGVLWRLQAARSRQRRRERECHVQSGHVRRHADAIGAARPVDDLHGHRFTGGEGHGRQRRWRVPSSGPSRPAHP